MAAVRRRYGVELAELNLGGGHAVPYVAGDEPFNLDAFADRIRRVVKAECAALYGARYTVRALHRPGEALEPVTVVGRHCEAGDVIAADVPLPAATRPGDLLVVPGTGAYNHSMASNYNMVGRPPVVAVRDGAARLLVRRETDDDLLLRDVGM
jgi:diaminopimelate decarboxylase